MFGTPAKPKVQGLNPEGEQALAEAKTELQLDDATLARGSQIYRIQCLHCHGLPGDGHGPTAFWVNPHPRDYRQGIFKFSSVDVTKVPDAKPRRDDLLRTLRIGIDGSSMPAFGLLSDRDLEDLVSYVIHLSLRGQFEFIVLQDLIGGTDTFSEDVTPDVLLKTLAVDRWLASQKPEAMIKPEKHDYKTEEELAQGIKRGWAAFKETTGGTGCLACHTDYGRQAKFRYDVWGTLNRPANLTSNMYRGGRTPLDLYYRLYSGIPGTAMPAFSGSSLDGQRAKYEKSGGKEGLKSAWDLVEFVRVLPYPAMREKYGIHIDRVD
jgi:mono/diheme cytochrome c family protein